METGAIEKFPLAMVKEGPFHSGLNLEGVTGLVNPR